MAHLVITSGPTRQYLDPVRYLSNASSGRMGAALASAAIQLGHRVTIVSGPVTVAYPSEARVVEVTTTVEMLAATLDVFQDADGLIGAAAPCDYAPRQVHTQKLSKTGEPVMVELVETPDIVATVAATKNPRQWVVGFALETEDARFRAIVKMQRKLCDMMVSNGPLAIDASQSAVEILGRDGKLREEVAGEKSMVASRILYWIHRELIDPTKS